MSRNVRSRRQSKYVAGKHSETKMTEKEIAALSSRIKRSTDQTLRVRPEATITSGFDLEVLRLSEKDVKFLTDCGVKVE